MLASCLSACGGTSTRNERNGGNESGGGGTAGVAAGTAAIAGTGGGGVGSPTIGGAAGSAGIGGSAGSAGACDICTDGVLTDFEVSAYNAHLQVAGVNEPAENHRVPTDPPRGDSLVAFHLSDEAELGGMNLGFHQHDAPFWALTATGPDLPYAAVRFWARRGIAGGPSLVFSVTGLEQELGNYQADLETGNPWLATRFPLADQWEQYVAFFRDLAPEGPGTVASTFDRGGQVLHFIVPEGEPLDVWIDDIELLCAEQTCE
jgi:hypothetical protein